MNIKEKFNQLKTNVGDYIDQKIQNTGPKTMVALQLIPMVNIVVRAVREKQLHADLTSENEEIKSLAERNLKQLRIASYVGTAIHITAAIVGTIALGILYPPSLSVTAPICGMIIGGYAGAEWAIRNRSSINEKAEKMREDGIKKKEAEKERIAKRKERINEAVGFKATLKAFFS